MNRQRKVVITVTYNDLGMIVDTKAEELNLSAQPNLQPACNQLATDSISRQAAIDAAIEAADEWDGGYNLTRANMIEDAINNIAPPTQPERKKGKWIRESLTTDYPYKCSACKKYTRAMYDFCPNCGADMRGEQE